MQPHYFINPNHGRNSIFKKQSACIVILYALVTKANYEKLYCSCKNVEMCSESHDFFIFMLQCIIKLFFSSTCIYGDLFDSRTPYSNLAKRKNTVFTMIPQAGILHTERVLDIVQSSVLQEKECYKKTIDELNIAWLATSDNFFIKEWRLNG